MEVRDPIHGAIAVSPEEVAIVDHPFVQRLRNIRSTGFSHLPFPGATHSRYSHCLGVMVLAGQAFDSAYQGWELPTVVRARFRALLRVAALCHDLGHAPFSHSTEFAMPSLGALGISWYRPDAVSDRRATHEDYTIAILEHTSLRDAIAASTDFTARHVAALISRDVEVEDDLFVVDGLDHRRVLSQIVSSELDVDRLDYLVRDSYYTGARYGQIDTSWLLSNLVAYPFDGRVSLALDFAAIYAFDDFMIARHHMFLMVYFHHKSVAYEELLKRYVLAEGTDWALPADLDAYLSVDDISLEHHLRTADSEWARRIVERRPFKRVLEVHGTPADVDLSEQALRLREAGVDVIHAGSTGKLSRYNVFGQKRERAPQIYVLERMPGLPVENVHGLQEASKVFQRYADARRIARLYVRPEEVGEARGVLGLPV
ncbi:MAG: HD domain-containing protein [Deltaproteobacteria bacterium]|nr:HD domain-containing protein [Deltaproteobacteria bacterium]